MVFWNSIKEVFDLIGLIEFKQEISNGDFVYFTDLKLCLSFGGKPFEWIETRNIVQTTGKQWNVS